MEINVIIIVSSSDHRRVQAVVKFGGMNYGSSFSNFQLLPQHEWPCNLWWHSRIHCCQCVKTTAMINEPNLYIFIFPTYEEIYEESERMVDQNQLRMLPRSSSQLIEVIWSSQTDNFTEINSQFKQLMSFKRAQKLFTNRQKQMRFSNHQQSKTLDLIFCNIIF